MKNKNKNIARFFSGKLPDPDIPVDDAWEEMSGMLDKAMPGAKNTPALKGSISSAVKLISAMVSLGVVVLGVVLFLNKQPEKNASAIEKNAKANNKTFANIEKSVAPNTNVEKSDTKNENGEDRKDPLNLDNANSSNVETNKTRKFPEKIQSKQKRSFRSYAGDNAGQKEIKNINNGFANGRPNRNRVKSRNIKNGFGDEIQNQSKSKSMHNATAGPDKRWAEITLLKLESKPHHFNAYDPGLAAKVSLPADGNIIRHALTKRINKAYEIGLEWNFNTPFRQTNFLFTGIDSVRKPALLLIPGIYLSKTLKEKQAITLTLSPYQPYFGNNGTLAEVLDSIPRPDSSFARRSTNLIKTASFHVGLQYQYHFAKHFAVGAGIAYSRIYGALVEEQGYNGNGPSRSKSRTLRNAMQMRPYLNPDIFFFKAGVSYHAGRFQTGINILAPVNNISSPQFPVRPVNGQFYLRFRVW